MKRKATKILFIYFLIIFINGCYCPDPDFPYFEFKAINITTDHPNPNYHEDGLLFTITFDSVNFVAQDNIQYFNNYAYALSCEENGDRGLKYNISEINIYSDSIFDSSIPHGAALNELFEISISYTDFFPLSDFNNRRINFNYSSDIRLFGQFIPVDLKRDYNFIIEIINENNGIIKSEAGPIKWSN